MRKRKVASIAFTGAAVAAIIGPAAPEARAASGTWEVTPGGAFNGSGSVNLTAGDGNIACTMSISGTLNSRNGSASSNNIGTLAGGTFGSPSNPCTTGPSSSLLTGVFTGGEISASKYAPGSNPPQTAVITGKIKDVNASFTGSINNSCTAKGAGSLSFSYRNSDSKLSFKPQGKLAMASLSGCSGILESSDSTQTGLGVLGSIPISPAQTIARPAQ